MIVLIVVVVLLVVFGISCVKIVPQAETMVIERLGSYLTTWGNGLHIKLPLIDRIRAQVSRTSPCTLLAAKLRPNQT